MHFDDRLATVLRLPATGDSLARIKYRQLVDILSRMPDSARGGGPQALLEDAFDALDFLKIRIPAVERARLIAQSGHPLANPRLVSQLAQAEPPVALAAIGRAHLAENAWLTLVPGLPVGARGILRHRTDLPMSVCALLDRLGVRDMVLPQAEASATASQFIEATPHRIEAAAASEPVASLQPAPTELILSEPSLPETTTLPPLELELAAIFGENYDAPQTEDVPDGKPATAPIFTQIATPPTPLSAPASRVPEPLDPEPRAQDAIASSTNVHALHPVRTTEQRPDSEIGAIVRRIEAYRKAREASPPVHISDTAGQSLRDPLATTAPRLPASLDFETDSLGRIVWAEGPYAPAIVGLQLAQAAGPDSLLTAFAERRPLTDHTIQLDGSPIVCGLWRIDAMPDFSSGGGFQGYYGRLRRRAQSHAEQIAGQTDFTHAGLGQFDNEGHSNTDSDGTKGCDAPGDRLREVLHELRTPANAIQVAAEIIQQQLYGPAPHEYRALAAAIAGDCAHILAGFEELERLVKLETSTMKLDPGECEFTTILSHVAERLRTWTQPRRSGFSLLNAPDDIRVSLTSSDAEMLAWRLLAALAGSTAPDEMLEIGWRRDTAQGTTNDIIAIRSALPARLSARDDSDFFAAVPGERGQSLAVGAFGTGFTLRLAAAEARAAGGGMRREGNDLVLWLPALTTASAQHSSFDAACIGV